MKPAALSISGAARLLRGAGGHAILWGVRICSARFITAGTRVEDCPADGRPAIVVAGRSNVGKSSLINAMTGQRGLARTSRRPGTTQALLFYLVNDAFYLVDLPGYGYAAPPDHIRKQWGPLVEGYLTRRSQPRGCLVLLDLRHAPSPQDLQLKAWLEAERLRTVYVATKADQVPRGRRRTHQEDLRRALDLTNDQALILFSAKTGEGRQEVWRIAAAWLV